MATSRALLVLALALPLASARLTSLPGFHTPQMGYNSWYDDFMNPSASAVLATADALKTSGLQAAGFTCAYPPPALPCPCAPPCLSYPSISIKPDPRHQHGRRHC